VRPDPHPTPEQVVVVDVGSSMTKLALVTGDDLTRLGSFATGGTGAVGWEARFDAALADAVSPESVSHLALSSVRHTLADRLRTWWAAHCRGPVPVRLVSADSVDLTIDYQPPSAVGSDRLANAVAAVVRSGAPVIVADIGTAITCDLVVEGPRFAGGAIAPGPGAAYQGLVDRAPHLAQAGGLVFHGELPVVPTSTAEAVRVGVLGGAAALVDGLVRSYQRLAGPCPVVATGGLGPALARHSDTITTVDPDLTLWGTHLATTTTTQRPPGAPVTTGSR
jgi:type III pantothenate kinase